MRILVLNGPNLNLLGVREPDVYGPLTLSDIEERLRREARDLGIDLEFFQSNHEGSLIDAIQDARDDYDGIVYNPGAHTHYSYAIRDAVAAIGIPVAEVHLSDITAREPFRSTSVIAPVCIGQVFGEGMNSYVRGLHMVADEVRSKYGSE